MKKEQYQIECTLNSSSVTNLWNSLSTESGLSRWFADNAEKISPALYRFTWEDESEDAEILEDRPREVFRMRWVEENDENVFFEFKIQTNEMTGLLSVLVTDFAEPAEYNDAKLLWNSQLDKLRRFLGA